MSVSWNIANSNVNTAWEIALLFKILVHITLTILTGKFKKKTAKDVLSQILFQRWSERVIKNDFPQISSPATVIIRWNNSYQILNLSKAILRTYFNH